MSQNKHPYYFGENEKQAGLGQLLSRLVRSSTRGRPGSSPSAFGEFPRVPSAHPSALAPRLITPSYVPPAKMPGFREAPVNDLLSKMKSMYQANGAGWYGFHMRDATDFIRKAIPGLEGAALRLGKGVATKADTWSGFDALKQMRELAAQGKLISNAQTGVARGAASLPSRQWSDWVSTPAGFTKNLDMLKLEEAMRVRHLLKAKQSL